MENRQTPAGWAWLIAMLAVLATALLVYVAGSASEPPDPILQQYEGLLLRLFPKASEWERVEDTQGAWIYRAVQGGRTLGHAAWQTAQGYAGPVEVIAAVDADGVITGIHVGGSGFRESEGRGALTRDASFTDQFRGRRPPVSLGRDIDAVSGATVTSQAVVDAVNAAAQRIQQKLEADDTN